ncbi:hypothetical protein [Streptomyces sp. H27-D2]|uniref:hypothetical protein n=1 Tax=Streptomyces sp. H27-D2 TaxID=3046304 RepID=UPI002DBE1CDE|nr:hypothetical protein [Streptomyces sp. H27-D2]MEC4016100.1 hypothetical protein [Streptomyces sp. H27-D2]
MSSPQRKIVRLQEMRAQRIEQKKLQYIDVIFEVPLTGDQPEGAVPVERTVSFLAQDYWPIEVVEAVKEENGGGNVAVMRKVATPVEAFDELIKAAQLTVGELVAIVEEMSGEAGTTQGEGNGS